MPQKSQRNRNYVRLYDVRIRKRIKALIILILPNRLLSFYASKVVKDYNSLSEGEIEFFLLINSYVREIIDVGPRTDAFYSLQNAISKTGRKVFMFEANPAFARVLTKKVPELNVTNFVFNVGIGNKPTEMYYYYDTQSFVSESRVGNISKLKSRKQILVRTIDSYRSEIKNCDFYKSDIEEMDFYALLGAKKTLANVHFLQFELGLGMPYKGRRVENIDYWSLLESDFHLYLLKDANPIWGAMPELPLLLELNSATKKIIEILQFSGNGFNIVGINRKKGIPDILKNKIGCL